MGLSLCTLLPFRETGVGVSGWHLHLGRGREYVDPLERCQLWRVAPTEFRLELVKPLFDTDENRHNPLSLRPPVAPGTADNAKGITTNYSVLNIHWQDWCWSWNSNTLATWCTGICTRYWYTGMWYSGSKSRKFSQWTALEKHPSSSTPCRVVPLTWLEDFLLIQLERIILGDYICHQIFVEFASIDLFIKMLVKSAKSIGGWDFV